MWRCGLVLSKVWRASLANSHHGLGDVIGRFATISDMHIGDHGFGIFPRVHPQDDHSSLGERCARAAVREAREFGADLLIVKGDLTGNSRPAEWVAAAAVIQEVGMPTLITVGNHEGGIRIPSFDTLRATAVDAGIHIDALDTEIAVHDIGPLRLILADSTKPHSEGGRISHVTEAICSAARDARATLLLTHHYPQRFNRPTMLPIGIPGREAAKFAHSLRQATNNVVWTSGHTHRNRTYQRHGVTVNEVGSTKDGIGAWGAYTVYEHGLVGETRHISDDWCQEWTAKTRSTLGGIYGRWSPGTYSDRATQITW